LSAARFAGDDDIDGGVGQGDVLQVAPQELDVLDPGRGGVGAREREHLAGHVEADGLAGHTDAAGADEHVRPCAGAEVQDGLSLVQVRNGGRDAASG
jgi:hypothetical protein